MASMTPGRWSALSPYLDQALDLPTHARVGWLGRLHAQDADLASDLQSLLDDRKELSRDDLLERGIGPQPEISGAGHRIGAYTLVSPIGRGGMGSVWLARRSDGRFEGHVAIKLLNLGFVGRSGEERFTREGTILARLRHRHIAQLIDAGVSTLGQPYLVLEHVEGEHIDAYCDRRALGVDARIRLFLDVLEAVGHAHANLIVHRDLKPSNVLVAADGDVKLLDFGIAKLIERGADAPSLTIDGGRVLTPEYAAPEQLVGGTITTATDVYSLGMLLYVLLGGPGPTEGRRVSAADLIKLILEHDAPPLSAVVPNGTAFRGDLDNILAKAMKKSPEERYASVSPLADDLRRYLRHEPVSARPDGLAYRSAKFARRHARVLAAGAGVLMVVAAIVLFYTARLGSERDRAKREAATSAAVSELLTNLLTGADPYVTHGHEPTVRDILDAGAVRVDHELRDRPEIRAAMLTVIGRVYQRLGAFDRAAPLLENAVRLARDNGETIRLGQSLNDFGVLRRERGDAKASRPLLEEALALRRTLLGPAHQDVAVTLVELGRTYEDLGMIDRAEPLFREALDIRRRVLGDNDAETATSKSALALLLWGRGDIAAAEPLFRQSLATSRAVLGEDDPNVASSLNNLGLILLDKGDYRGAEPMFRQSLAIKRKQFGDAHPSLVPSLNNLSGALREQGRYDEARQLLEDALRIARHALGEDHSSIAGLEANLARVHLAQNDIAAAESLTRDALRRQQQISSRDDWKLAATASLLGGVLVRRGDYREAEPLLLDAAGVLKDVPGRQGREAAATRQRLATLYEAVGRADAAERYRSTL